MEEARALSKLKGLQCVAQYVDNGTFKASVANREAVHPRFLVQQFIEGTVLAEAFAKPEDFTGISSAADWFKLAISIVDALLAVHQRGVVHNDIWHRNIMLKKDGKPVLIDFGEAIFRTARDLGYVDEPRRQDPWIAPEWNWTHIRPSRRADIFALGGVLFWMACGSEPPMPDADIERAKLDVETLIRMRNEPILRENIAIADIIARCRRHDRNCRVPNAEELRRELLTYSRESSPTNVVETAQHVLERARRIDLRENVFLVRMADIFLRQTQRQLEDMCTGAIDISGNHESLVSGCVDALASLDKGDEYLAVSTLKFWKPRNIGVRGRFLSMTHLCAQRGARIKRVFLLTDADQLDEHFWPIMKAQIERLSPEPAEGDLVTRYLFLSTRDFAERMDRGEHCGFWISSNQVMEIVPIYDDQDILRSIRLITSDVAPSFIRERFAKDFKKAEPLTLEALTNSLSRQQDAPEES